MKLIQFITVIRCCKFIYILLQFSKIQTVTTKANSIKQTKAGILPVEVSDSDVTEDLLWCTEMERYKNILRINTIGPFVREK